MRRNDEKSRRGSGSTDFSRFGSSDRGRFSSSPREMHKATCADCGKGCEVPFIPKEGRPVYCKECYAKHKPQRF
ncbi:hypothetical protein COV14_00600 [Candidatus Woesearchaeota archaeon CG10_big_fil_rev_8_21_14_0_10_33_12]|nr:MAG: hypothetical protein COV14_00600 [Candidatus Woesearchaeota archaeon CG10_big_fil_rev_8_21_14_0_10_33_12]